MCKDVYMEQQWHVDTRRGFVNSGVRADKEEEAPHHAAPHHVGVPFDLGRPDVVDVCIRVFAKLKKVSLCGHEEEESY